MNKNERISRLEAQVMQLRNTINLTQLDQNTAIKKIKQLECYETYGHDWLYMPISGLVGTGMSHWSSAMGRKERDFKFQCRDCGKIDDFDWDELDSNMRAQIRAIDPDKVPTKKN